MQYSIKNYLAFNCTETAIFSKNQGIMATLRCLDCAQKCTLVSDSLIPCQSLKMLSTP